MKHDIAYVKNLVRATAALDELVNRNLGVPGMGLFYGCTGYGKTTTITWLMNKYNGIYLRANKVWTPTSMLNAMVLELDLEMGGTLSDKLDRINREIALTKRPLFIDEADRLISNDRLIETLRDIHDITSQPVILTGEDGFEKKIKNRRRLARRITQPIEFTSTDFDDALTLRNTICDVGVTDELMDLLHDKAQGSIGLMVAGLAKIEQAARANDWETVDPIKWGQRPFFLGTPPPRVR